MIYANKGMIGIEGNRAEVLAEFSTVCLAMKDGFMKQGESEADAKQLLQESLETAFMPDEEINEVAHGLEEVLSGILEKRERMV